MRKTIWSLAALMLFMVATVMTSCSKEDDVVTPKENVVTLTVQMPEEAQSRVSVIDDGTINLIDWELGDTVKVYNVQRNPDTGDIEVTGGHVFRCTDLATYEFKGILPEGKTLQDYNVAVYGHDIESVYHNKEAGFYDNKVSTNLKDVIFLAGEITADSCILDIRNNVVKVSNSKEPVEVAWGWDGVPGFFVKPYYCLNEKDHFAPGVVLDPYGITFPKISYTIPTGESYILMPPIAPQNLCLLRSNRVPIVTTDKLSGLPVSTVGKLFDVGSITSGSVVFKTSDFSYSDTSIDANKLGIILGLERFGGVFTKDSVGNIICDNPASYDKLVVKVFSNAGNIKRVSCSADGSIPLEGDGTNGQVWVLDASDEGWKNESDKFLDYIIDPSQTITVDYEW